MTQPAEMFRAAPIFDADHAVENGSAETGKLMLGPVEVRSVWAA
jgi:hypothetical protein